MKSIKSGTFIAIFPLILGVSLFYAENLGGGLLSAARENPLADEPLAADMFAASARLTASDAAANDDFGCNGQNSW